MEAKAVVILAFCGLAAGEAVKPRGERQLDPSQFSQFASQFQETFKPPNMGSSPFGELPQLPGGSGGSFIPNMGKRQLDPSQFSQFASQFQETFKPPNMGSSPFGELPQFPGGGGSGGSFIPNMGKRQLDPSQFSQFANQFQETFKPPSMGSNPFAGFPQLPSGGQSVLSSFTSPFGKRRSA